jgi:hypothetical protein
MQRSSVTPAKMIRLANLPRKSLRRSSTGPAPYRPSIQIVRVAGPSVPNKRLPKQSQGKGAANVLAARIHIAKTFRCVVAPQVPAGGTFGRPAAASTAAACGSACGVPPIFD